MGEGGGLAIARSFDEEGNANLRFSFLVVEDVEHEEGFLGGGLADLSAGHGCGKMKS